MQYTCQNAQITDADERMPFVGGASDGWNGVACMNFFRIDSVVNASLSLSARKMWAFFDDGAVSITVGVRASGSSANVTTGIEQRVLDGK
jgi:hypothetical protein